MTMIINLKILSVLKRHVSLFKIQQRCPAISLRRNGIEERNFSTISGKIKSDLPSSDLFVNFALVGPPGSGKGTYGSLLSKKFGCKLVTVSDILRNHVEHQTNIGKQVEFCQREGKLADDNLVSKAVISFLLNQNFHKKIEEYENDQDYVNQKNSTKKKNEEKRVGFILDGYPRTLQQIQLMEAIDDTWPNYLKVHKVINIDVPDDICLSKMLGRRFCTKCKRSYNVNNVDSNGFIMPPQLPEPSCNCDKSVTWIKREDDTKEIILRRLTDYHAETKKVVSFYKNQGNLLSFVPKNGLLDMYKLEEIVQNKLEDSQ